MNISINHN